MMCNAGITTDIYSDPRESTGAPSFLCSFVQPLPLHPSVIPTPSPTAPELQQDFFVGKLEYGQQLQQDEQPRVTAVREEACVLVLHDANGKTSKIMANNDSPNDPQYLDQIVMSSKL